MKEKGLYLLTSAVLLAAVAFSLFSGIWVEKNTGIADVSVLIRVRYAFSGGSEDTFFEYDKQGRETFRMFLNDGAPIYVYRCGYYENDRVLSDEWQHYTGEYHSAGLSLCADYFSMHSKTMYEYFDDGEISRTVTFSDGDISEISTVSYENGEKREYVEWRYPNRISTYIGCLDADGKYLKREWPEDSELDEYEYEYDDRNRVVKETMSCQRYGVKTYDYISNYTYYDDSEQKKTETTTTTSFYADGTVSQTHRYYYFDIYGNTIEIGDIIDGEYLPESRGTYRYDETGRVISESLTYFLENGETTETHSYVYDSATGHLLKEEWLSEDAEKVRDTVHTYVYKSGTDDLQEEREIFSSSVQGYKQTQIRYVYDRETGLIQREEAYATDDSKIPLAQTGVTVYTYNDRGDLIKKEVSSIYEREREVTEYVYADLQDVYPQQGWFSEAHRILRKATIQQYVDEFKAKWKKMLSTVESWF